MSEEQAAVLPLVPVAVVDANVLYPASLRDLFLTLATSRLYLPKWTDKIHEEWMENLLDEDRKRHNPPRLERARLERTRDLMERASPRSRVTDNESLIPTLSLPDADDRHVLAAAIASGAPVIVTFNRRDFPRSTLADYGIRAVHPDDFLCGLYDDAPEQFRSAIGQILDRLKNPPRSWAEHIELLRDNRLPKLAARLA